MLLITLYNTKALMSKICSTIYTTSEIINLVKVISSTTNFIFLYLRTQKGIKIVKYSQNNIKKILSMKVFIILLLRSYTFAYDEK